jgi:type IV pilus assembly protein PilQ
MNTNTIFFRNTKDTGGKMNFLQVLKNLGKKTTLAVAIASCLTASIYSQTPSKCNTYGCAGFVGEAIDLNVVNTDIREILSHLTNEYGINFVIDNSVKSTPITTNLNNVPWNMALDAILQSQGLSIQINGPILRVADVEKLNKEEEGLKQLASGKLDRSPLYTEFVRLNFATASGSAGGTGFTTGTEAGGGDSGASSSASAGGSGGGLLGIIKKRLSRRGAIEVDTRSNTLIITDVRENLDAVRQLITLLDQPEPQVEIEARIVVADRNFSRDIGVQIGALVLGNRGSGASGGTLGGNGAGNSTGLVPNGAPNGLIQRPDGSLLSAIPSTIIGLTTGIFGTAQISALISAGEKQGQAKTIATPRVTTLNNRKAEISSGQQIPVRTIQPGGTGSAAIITTTYINVPLRLEVIPQISDTGTVMLDVTAENSSVPASDGSVAPSITTQKMKTNVLVPDGGTTVVGGALLDTESDSQNRTPGLSKIPVIKNLFRRKAVSRTSSEILFFITPRIYRPDFAGNPTSGTVSTGTRTTTILQPVPLGNPTSNSEAPQNLPQQNTQQPSALPNAMPSKP